MGGDDFREAQNESDNNNEFCSSSESVNSSSSSSDKDFASEGEVEEDESLLKNVSHLDIANKASLAALKEKLKSLGLAADNININSITNNNNDQNENQYNYDDEDGNSSKSVDETKYSSLDEEVFQPFIEGVKMGKEMEEKIKTSTITQEEVLDQLNQLETLIDSLNQEEQQEELIVQKEEEQMKRKMEIERSKWAALRQKQQEIKLKDKMQKKMLKNEQFINSGGTNTMGPMYSWWLQQRDKQLQMSQQAKEQQLHCNLNLDENAFSTSLNHVIDIDQDQIQTIHQEQQDKESDITLNKIQSIQSESFKKEENVNNSDARKEFVKGNDSNNDNDDDLYESDFTSEEETISTFNKKKKNNKLHQIMEQSGGVEQYLRDMKNETKRQQQAAMLNANNDCAIKQSISKETKMGGSLSALQCQSQKRKKLSLSLDQLAMFFDEQHNLTFEKTQHNKEMTEQFIKSLHIPSEDDVYDSKSDGYDDSVDNRLLYDANQLNMKGELITDLKRNALFKIDQEEEKEIMKQNDYSYMNDDYNGYRVVIRSNGVKGGVGKVFCTKKDRVVKKGSRAREAAQLGMLGELFKGQGRFVPPDEGYFEVKQNKSLMEYIKRYFEVSEKEIFAKNQDGDVISGNLFLDEIVIPNAESQYQLQMQNKDRLRQLKIKNKAIRDAKAVKQQGKLKDTEQLIEQNDQKCCENQESQISQNSELLYNKYHFKKNNKITNISNQIKIQAKQHLLQQQKTFFNLQMEN